MNKILLVAFVLCGLVAGAQTIPGYLKRNVKDQTIAYWSDSSIGVTGYAGTPYLRSGVTTRSGQYGVDTTNHQFYFYSDAWLRLIKISELQDTATAIRTTVNSKESALTFSTGLTRSVNTITVNTSQNIATLSNLTSNGIIKTSGGVGTLGIAVAGDFPTLNQSTTGSAATLTTGRTLGITGDLVWTSPSFDGSANVTAAGTIQADVVTNSKLANVATQTFKGRTTAATGDPEDLTVTQATAMLNTFTTALKGLVPPPVTSDGTKFINDAGAWAVPPGSGGAANTLIGGSGYPVLKTATQEIKKLFTGSSVEIDSISNTDGITIKAGRLNDYSSQSSSKVNSTKLRFVNTAVKSEWWDGNRISSNNDTLFTKGGWHSGPAVTDSIHYSVDEGVTWVGYAGKLPMAMHTFVDFMSPDGWHYILGSDYLATTAQKKTVWRSRDLINWSVRTSDYGGSARILGGGFADEYSNLYWLGGQTGVTAGTGLNDIWKSIDGGLTWTQIATGVSVGGDSFLGKNISNQVVYLNGRVYVIGGGVYDSGTPGSNTYTKKVHSASISDLTKWRAESDISFALGAQYISVSIWDGKIWAVGGYNGTTNTNEIAYMDASGAWRAYYNYFENDLTSLVTASHAGGLGVHRDKMYYVMGNARNLAAVFERSTLLDSFTVRKAINIDDYMSMSQILNSKAALFGNNVIAGTASNTIQRKSAVDNATYLYMSPTRGHVFGRALNSTAGTNVSDTTNAGMIFTPSGRLIISDNSNLESVVGLPYTLINEGGYFGTGPIRSSNYNGSVDRVSYWDENGNLEVSSMITDNGSKLSIGSGAVPIALLDIYRVNSGTLSTFTGAVSGSNVALSSLYSIPSYTGGLVWYTTDNNPTIPKSLLLGRNTGSGSENVFYVSNDYAVAPSIAALTIGVTGIQVVGDATVTDEAYDATGWNGDLSVPTKNAVRDKIESLAGGGITDLTGDGAATGPGSSILTLATVNSNVGSFTNANITVNAKGLITAAANGTAGTGDFVGPASSTDNALLRFDGTTGKLGQNGVTTVTDAGLFTMFGGSADWDETTFGLTKGTIHLTPSETSNHGSAITFGASYNSTTLAQAQAAIYTRSGGAFGSRMYFATTDDFTPGAKTRMRISETGEIRIGSLVSGGGSKMIVSDAEGDLSTATIPTGTVTAVSIASANGLAGSSSGGATPVLTLSTTVTGVLKGNGTAISAATSGTDYSLGTSALATGILLSTTTTGALTIAVAGDFPTLNQSTTGSAATWTTGRTIAITGDIAYTSPSFNGSANVTAAGTIQNLAVTNAKINDVAWSKVTGTPTTLAGYGITDGGGLTEEQVQDFVGNMINDGTLVYVDATPTLRRAAITGDVSVPAGDNVSVIQANVVNGTHIALGSDATGDVMYYDGTNYIRLAAGTNTHVLTLTGGVPTWAAPGGGGGLTINSTAITSGIAGRLLFENASNQVSQSANLFYDITNTSLLVAGATYSSGKGEIQVGGSIRLSGTSYTGDASPTVYLNNTAAAHEYAFNADNSGGFQIYDVTGGNASRFYMDGNGNIGLYNIVSPSARLHLPAGTTGEVPFKLTTGTAATTPEDGAIEYHASHLYFTTGGVRYQLDQQGGGGISEVFGTTNRITVATGTSTPTVDISSSYVGQTSLVTLGTITTGTWTATKISEVYGGTDQSAYTTGDMLYSSSTNNLSKIGIGSTEDMLTVAGGVPLWTPQWVILLGQDGGTIDNTGTSETDLHAIVIEANRLDSDEESIYGNFSGSFNDNGATVQLRVYWGGNSILNTSVLSVVSLSSWDIDIKVMRTSSTTARAVVRGYTPGCTTPLFTVYTALTSQDFTSGITMKVTGQAGGGTGGSGDISSTVFKFFWANAIAD